MGVKNLTRKISNNTPDKSFTNVMANLKAGLWIRIHFLRIRTPQFFWKRIRIQEVKWMRIHVGPDPCKKQWSFVQIYFKSWIKLQLLANFLVFFLFLFEKFSLLNQDPDPGGKMNADPDPQPWCSVTASSALWEVSWIRTFKLRSNWFQMSLAHKKSPLVSL